MDLEGYFENAEGFGLLATAGADGTVDTAIYAKPHFLENGTVAFIMADRLSHKNVTENPKAAYTFVERGEGYKGKRLYLTKTAEDSDPERIAAMRRRALPAECEARGEKRFLVTFRIDQVRPLVGD